MHRTDLIRPVISRVSAWRSSAIISRGRNSSAITSRGSISAVPSSFDLIPDLTEEALPADVGVELTRHALVSLPLRSRCDVPRLALVLVLASRADTAQGAAGRVAGLVDPTFLERPNSCEDDEPDAALQSVSRGKPSRRMSRPRTKTVGRILADLRPRRDIGETAAGWG